MDTLATIQGPEPTTSKVQSSQEVLVEEHNRRVATVKRRVKEELEKVGHTTDDDVKMVNGKYVGLFVLPSNSHVYVGFGVMGGQQAYRGEETKFDPVECSKAVVTYISRTQ